MRRIVSLFVLTFFIFFQLVGSTPGTSGPDPQDESNLISIINPNSVLQDELSHFTSYSELESLLQQLANRFDNIMKLYNNRGRSYEGRSLWMVKISDNPGSNEEHEPEVLFVGAHHGNELIGNEMAIHIIETFLEGFGKDPRITWMVKNHEIWVIPMPNPDGTEYSLNVESWRKNRSPNYISESTPGPLDPKVYPSSYGVDLNRNYDIEWGDPGGSRRLVQQSGTYSGPEPFSDSETPLIRDHVIAHNFTFYMDYHSGIEIILYPWGYKSEPTPDRALFERLGEHLSEQTGIDAIQGYDLYQTNGDAIDWIYTVTRTLSFTVELSDTNRPDEERVKAILENHIQSPLYLTCISSDPKTGSQIKIIHKNIGNQSDIGPYPITAMVKGVTELSGLEVRLYYKVGTNDYTMVAMENLKDKLNQYTAEIPTQGPGMTIRYFITVEGEGILISSPEQPLIYEFDIIALPESVTTNSEIVAMILMMIIIMGFFWGGFGYASFMALKAEQRKLHEYQYGD
jgi:hypothetical protein